MELRPLGAIGTVTGSKHLVRWEDHQILVDCGLFQGYKQLRERNWQPPPFDPAALDAVIVTHAHLDHTGYLPIVVRGGFRGPIYSTPATRALAAILLLDAAHLLEEEAHFANRHGFSKHKPALPLFTRRDAEAALERFVPIDYRTPIRLPDGVTASLVRAGHIPGAAMVMIETAHGGRLLFTGDLGRPNDPLAPPPDPIDRADYLVAESTYGNRRHSSINVDELLAAIINRTTQRGGAIVIPAFAVARTQLLLLRIGRLKAAGSISPLLPVFLDSPMASAVTEIFRKFPDEHRLSAQECRELCGVARFVRSVEESKTLDANPTPRIIIAGSGMVTGGRVLHHLKALAPNHRNTILLVGFQAPGTRGAALASGATQIKIHGGYVQVKSEVTSIPLSAHVDSDEMIAWMRNFREPPRQTFLVHGEPDAADALRRRVTEELGWTCRVPEHLESIPLDI